MKKILLFVLLACLSAVGAFAQSTSSSSSGQANFSVGAEGAVPVGNYSDLYSFGYGVSFKAAMLVGNNTDFTLSAGYMSFQVKYEVKQALLASGNSASAGGFVPLKAGLRVHDANGLFFEGQLGAAIATTGGGGTAFAYAPGIGFISESGVELGVRYEAWTRNSQTFGQMVAHLGYNFR